MKESKITQKDKDKFLESISHKMDYKRGMYNPLSSEEYSSLEGWQQDLINKIYHNWESRYVGHDE
tara:strand:+ start:2270 stop:2464 length:195 start_codon:yes stop_codon:yes gene_type:complete